MTPIEVLFVLLSPFTGLGIYDRRKWILAKLNVWTKAKPKEAPK